MISKRNIKRFFPLTNHCNALIVRESLNKSKLDTENEMSNQFLFVILCIHSLVSIEAFLGFTWKKSWIYYEPVFPTDNQRLDDVTSHQIKQKLDNFDPTNEQTFQMVRIESKMISIFFTFLLFSLRTFFGFCLLCLALFYESSIFQEWRSDVYNGRR